MCACDKPCAAELPEALQLDKNPWKFEMHFTLKLYRRA